MTLPASGNITMAQVLAELQIANGARPYPISLGDTDVRALAGVPSGNISMSNLYGKSANWVLDFSGTCHAVDLSSPFAATASVTLTTSGSITRTTTPAASQQTVGASWCATAPPTTWVYVTASNTTGLTGTLNTWLQVSASNVGHSLAISTGITRTSVLTYTFSATSGGSTIATRTVTLIAEGAL